MCLKFFHSLIRLARENDIAQIYGSWFLSHFGGAQSVFLLNLIPLLSCPMESLSGLLFFKLTSAGEVIFFPLIKSPLLPL